MRVLVTVRPARSATPSPRRCSTAASRCGRLVPRAKARGRRLRRGSSPSSSTPLTPRPSREGPPPGLRDGLQLDWGSGGKWVPAEAIFDRVHAVRMRRLPAGQTRGVRRFPSTPDPTSSTPNPGDRFERDDGRGLYPKCNGV